jgi:hypothetical protein
LLTYLVATLCIAPPAPANSDFVRDLPNVAKVEASIVVEKPKHYLIHILDWHFIPKEDFIADLWGQGIEDELDAKYEQHLDDVEAVQVAQKALLLALVESRGSQKST